MIKRTEMLHLISKRLIIVLLFLLTFSISSDTFAQTSEWEMKAVAFEKLSLFTEWPAGAFDKSKNEFIIEVLGQNPFGKTLEEVYNGRKIKNRNVKIIYAGNISQLTPCHLLYISKIKKSDLPGVIDYARANHILTIADTKGFAEAGCFINFFNYEGKLRFEINQKELESAGFTVDYKLLRVSKIVNTTGK